MKLQFRKGRSGSTHLKLGWALAAAAGGILSGCAWRTTQADHVIGPVLYRFTQTDAAKAAVWQTVHVPLLLEGGRHWGISFGIAQRLTLSPGEPALTRSAYSNTAPSGWLIDPAPGRWHWSWTYLRAPARQPPEFIHRSLAGIYGGGGAEHRAVSIGYSSVTATHPRREALYNIDFNSRRPLDSTFFLKPPVMTANTTIDDANDDSLP